MAPPWIRNLRMKTAVGLRKLEQKGLRSRSPSVRKQWKALRPAIGRITHKIRLPHPFFPFEKFVSLEELGNSDSYGETQEAFAQIKKGLWWKKYGEPIPTGIFLGGTIPFFITSAMPNRPVLLVVSTGIMFTSLAVSFKLLKGNFLERKGRQRFQKNISAVTTFLQRTNHPRLRKLIDSGTFNMVVVDLENNGFRFAKIVPKERDLMIQLLNEPRGGVVAFDKNGKLVRGVSINDGKAFLPEPERRKEKERRYGKDRRSGREFRRKIVAQPFPERRGFTGRRKGERRAGKERRAPPEERTEHHF